MKETGTFSLRVQGRISSVRWLEDAPFKAKKVRGSKYFHYELSGLSAGLVEQIQRDLEETEGVWTSPDIEDYEWEAPHPTFAGFAGILKQPRYNCQLQAGGLTFAEPDNDECLEFALLQIEKLRFQLEDAGYGPQAEEVQSIANEVEKRGGDAYAQYKPRLQALTK